MIIIYVKDIVFKEISKSLYYTLLSMNYECKMSNHIDSESDNLYILFGGHTLVQNPPKKYIVYQLEQFNVSIEKYGKVDINIKQEYLNILYNSIKIWDYSKENINYIKKKFNYKNICHVPIGFSQYLERIPKKSKKDIDILFFGSLSKRRTKILDKLKKLVNIKICAYNIWNEEREKLIARSKIVINIHYYYNGIMEMPRLTYLLANKIFIISEYGRNKILNKQLENNLILCKYNELISKCLYYLKNDKERFKIRKQGYLWFKTQLYSNFIPINDITNHKTNKIIKKSNKIKYIITNEIIDAETYTNSDNNFILKLNKINEHDLPNVSIITPTRNRRLLFSMAIRNWMLTIYPKNKLQWIIFDDGFDNLSDILPKDSRILYLFESHKNPLSIAEKRNRCIQLATNPYIVFMDDDDYYRPEHVYSRIKTLLTYKSKGIKCVGCKYMGCFDIIRNENNVSTNGNKSLVTASSCFHISFWTDRPFYNTDTCNEIRKFTLFRQNQIISIPFQFVMIALTHNTNITKLARVLKDSEKNQKQIFDFFDLETQFFLSQLQKQIIKYSNPIKKNLITPIKVIL